MIYEGFKIHSVEHIQEAYCQNKRCKTKPEMLEVSNGFLSRALFCPACHSVYILRLELVPKTHKNYKEFKQQCLDELRHDQLKKEAIGKLVLEQTQRKARERDARVQKEIARLDKRNAKKKK